MISTRGPLVSLLAMIAVLVLAPSAVRAQGDVDLSKLPPDPAKLEKKLSSSPTSLSKAIELAKASFDGTNAAVGSARAYQKTGKSLIDVIVYSGGGKWRVTIDAAAGKVLTKDPVSRFPGAPTKGEMVTTDSGLMYYDMVVGDGKKPASATSRVKVHYSGWTVDGKMFDSSVERGRPASFRLNQVIKGWTEGVQSMKVGGKRKLIIPYQLAYGERGRPGAIPPKAMLVFDIELLDIL